MKSMNVTDDLWEAIRAQDFDAVRAALGEGADVNEEDDEGYTPVVLASGGQLAIVKLLIEHGADINHWSRENNVLIVAASAGNRKNYEYLRPLVSKRIRATATEADVARGEVLRARNRDPLVDEFVLAAARGKLEEVNSALAMGANPNSYNSNGWTPLQYAAYYGHSPVIDALLAAGAEVDMPAEDKGRAVAGLTALGFVSGSGYTRDHEAIIRRLIAAGARVDVQDARGTTPLMQATDYGFPNSPGLPAAARALLEAGANLELKDAAGRTALKIAIDRKRSAIAEMLRAAGAQEP